MNTSLFSSRVSLSANSAKDPRNFVFAGRSYKVVLDLQDGGVRGISWQSGKNASFAGREMLSAAKDDAVFSPGFLKAAASAMEASVKLYRENGFKLSEKTSKNGKTYQVLELA